MKYESSLSSTVNNTAEIKNRTKNNTYLFGNRNFGIKKYMLKYTAEITTGREKRQ